MDSNTHSRSDEEISMRSEELCCSYCTEKFASRMGLYHHFHNQHSISQAFRGYRVFAGSTQPADFEIRDTNLPIESLNVPANHVSLTVRESAHKATEPTPLFPRSVINSSISVNVSQPEQTNSIIAYDINTSEIKVEKQIFSSDMPFSTSVPSILNAAVSINTSTPIANVINSASEVEVNYSQSDYSPTIGSIKFVDEPATFETMQVNNVGQSSSKSVTSEVLSTTPPATTSDELHKPTETLLQSRPSPSQHLEYSNIPNLHNRRYQSFYPPEYASQSIQSGVPRFFNTLPDNSADNIKSEDETMTNEPRPSVTLHYRPAMGVGPLYGASRYPSDYHHDSSLRTSYLYNPNCRLPNPRSVNRNGPQAYSLQRKY